MHSGNEGEKKMMISNDKGDICISDQLHLVSYIKKYSNRSKKPKLRHCVQMSRVGFGSCITPQEFQQQAIEAEDIFSFEGYDEPTLELPEDMKPLHPLKVMKDIIQKEVKRKLEDNSAPEGKIPELKTIQDILKPLKVTQSKRFMRFKKVIPNVMTPYLSDKIHSQRCNAENDNNDDNNNNDIIDSKEILLHVAIYRSGDHSLQSRFLLKSSDPLSKLKDVLECPSDTVDDKTKECLSGYFFIEGVFYEDTRNNESIKYSTEVLTFTRENGCARAKQAGLDIYDTKNMQDILLNDIPLRLGSHYIYCHQGNCEHIVIFHEMRQITNSDPSNKSQYPFPLFKASQLEKCMVCSKFTGEIITEGDVLAPYYITHFCKECFQLLHESPDEENSLLYSSFIKQELPPPE